MEHRWPKSVHSQIEAIFHNIRSIGETKEKNPHGIRSFGVWKAYKYEAHRFASFMKGWGVTDLLETVSVHDCLRQYLENKLTHYVGMQRSRQTMETALAALAKFTYALNHYIEQHVPETPQLETEQLRLEFNARSKKLLRKSSKFFANRAYPDPIRLIAAIDHSSYQLQATMQYEGGLRAEGVGAPSNCRIKNPMTLEGLHGIGNDPVTGDRVGIVSSKEKGGKITEHYISTKIYQRLLDHIMKHGELATDYNSYVDAINQAAQKTGQYARGRGSHGLKFNFAQERYMECVKHGMTHEQALQQTSCETAHFRLRETLTYTRG